MLQIFKYNIRHMNVIAIQNIILKTEIPNGSAKKKLGIDMPNAKIIWIYIITNVLLKYNWYLNLINNEDVVDLRV